MRIRKSMLPSERCRRAVWRPEHRIFPRSPSGTWPSTDAYIRAYYGLNGLGRPAMYGL